MKKAKSQGRSASGSRRMKCACASCQCTVDLDRGVRKGNLVYCSEMCARGCTPEQCRCEHDHCAMN